MSMLTGLTNFYQCYEQTFIYNLLIMNELVCSLLYAERLLFQKENLARPQVYVTKVVGSLT